VNQKHYNILQRLLLEVTSTYFVLNNWLTNWLIDWLGIDWLGEAEFVGVENAGVVKQHQTAELENLRQNLY